MSHHLGSSTFDLVDSEVYRGDHNRLAESVRDLKLQARFPKGNSWLRSLIRFGYCYRRYRDNERRKDERIPAGLFQCVGTEQRLDAASSAIVRR